MDERSKNTFAFLRIELCISAERRRKKNSSTPGQRNSKHEFLFIRTHQRIRTQIIRWKKIVCIHLRRCYSIGRRGANRKQTSVMLRHERSIRLSLSRVRCARMPPIACESVVRFRFSFTLVVLVHYDRDRVRLYVSKFQSRIACQWMDSSAHNVFVFSLSCYRSDEWWRFSSFDFSFLYSHSHRLCGLTKSFVFGEINDVPLIADKKIFLTRFLSIATKKHIYEMGSPIEIDSIDEWALCLCIQNSISEFRFCIKTEDGWLIDDWVGGLGCPLSGRVNQLIKIRKSQNITCDVRPQANHDLWWNEYSEKNRAPFHWNRLIALSVRRALNHRPELSWGKWRSLKILQLGSNFEVLVVKSEFFIGAMNQAIHWNCKWKPKQFDIYVVVV